MVTPRVDLVKGDGMEWFVTGDYTYWTAREDNIEFAVVDTPQGAVLAQDVCAGTSIPSE